MADPTLQFGATDSDKIVHDVSENEFQYYIDSSLVATMKGTGDFLKVEGPLKVEGETQTTLVEIDQGSAPGTTTDKLYNVSGDLFWNAQNLSLNADTSLIQDGDTDTLVETAKSGNSNTIIMTTNGSERLRIASNGRIGIGTNIPQVGLDIQQGDLDASDRNILIGVTSFQFDYDRGNLGLGVTNPQSQLHMERTIKLNDYQHLSDTVNKLYAVGGDLYWNQQSVTGNGSFMQDDVGDSCRLETVNTDEITFKTSSVERLIMTADGHLIPQANSAYDLGTTANRFRDLYLSGNSINMDGTILGADSDDFTVETNGSQRMVIDSSGNMGIGTDTVDQMLHMYKSEDPTIKLQADANTDGFEISLDTSGDGVLNAKGSTGRICLDTNDEIRLVVQEDGDVRVNQSFIVLQGEGRESYFQGELGVSGVLYPNKIGVNKTVGASYKVDVDGSVNLSDTYAYYIDDSNVLAEDTLGSGVVNSSLTNVGILTALVVDGELGVSGTHYSQHIIPNLDDVYDLGTTSKRFRDLYLGPGSLHLGEQSRISGDPSSNGDLVFSTSESNERMRIMNNGNVGMGSTNPQNALDVVGDSDVTGVYKVDDVEVLSGTSLGSGVVGSSLTSVGDLTGLTVSGSSLMSDLVVTNNATVLGNLNVVGSTTTLSAQQVHVVDPMIKLASNNTTSDLYDIGIYGLIDGGVTKFSGLIRDASEGKYFLFDGTSTEPGITQATLTHAYATFDTLNDRVGFGLGITAPSVELEVGGDMKGDNLELNDAQIGYNLDLTFASSGIGGTERMRLDTSGNLGIGTDTPAARLDIQSDTQQVLVKAISNQNTATVELQGTYFSNAGKENEAELLFTNFDANLSATNNLALMAGYVTDSLLNVGDLVFYNYPEGDEAFRTMTLTKDSDVGIGVTAPSEKLDVDGNLNLTDGNQMNIDGNLIIDETQLGSSVVASSLTSVGTLTSLTVTGDLTVDTDTLKVDSGNNRVGINSASPTQALDVDGNVLVQDGNLYLFSTAEKIQSDNSEMTFHVGSSERMVIDSSGQLGVGVAGPSYQLDVAAGDANLASGDYRIGGTSVLNSTTLGSEVVNSSLTSIGSLTGLDVDGHADISGSLGVSGTAYLDALEVDQDVLVKGGDLYLGDLNSSVSADGSDLRVTNDSTERLTILNDGKVGLNDTSPDYALDVGTGNSDINVAVGVYRIADTEVLSATTLGGAVVNSSLENVGDLDDLTIVGDLTVDTNTLIVDSTNNRVMIGITEGGTGSNLHVHDASGDVLLMMTNNTTGTENTSGLHVKVTSSDVCIENKEIGGDIKLAVDGTNMIYIDGAVGRVGIGSDSPAYKVDVVGDVAIDGPSDYRVGVNSVLNTNTLGSTVVNSSLTNVGSLTSVTVSGTSDLQGDADIGGNLTVTGDLTVSGTTTTVDTQTLTVDDPMIRLASGNTANIIDIGIYGHYVDSGVTYFTGLIKDSTVDKYYLFDGGLDEPGLTEGNVTKSYVTFDTGNARVGMGLGVTAPSVALEVDGTVKCDDLELSSEIGYTTPLQFSNGGVGGTVRMTLDTSGNLGVQKAPGGSYALDVDGDAQLDSGHSLYIDDANVLSKTTLGSSVVGSSLTSVASLTDLTVTGNVGLSGSAVPTVVDLAIGDANTGLKQEGEDELAIFTGAVERMRFDSAGFTGIGNVNPTRKLHLNEASAAGCQLKFTNTTTGALISDGLDVGVDGSGNATFINNESTDYIFYNDGSTERMRLKTSSGNLGIGTATVDEKLHVFTDGGSGGAKIEADDSAYLVLNSDFDNSGVADAYILFEDNDTDIWSMGYDASQSNSFHIGTGAFATAPKMTIEAAGNVGVGTTNPGQLLDVNGVGAFRTSLAVGGNFTPSSIDLAIGDANTGLHGAGEDELQILTGGTERMRFDDSGLIGMGVDPTVDLHLQKSTDSADVAMIISNTSTTGQADAKLHIETASGGSGDPHLELSTNANTWSLGADHSDSDKLKLGLGAVSGNQLMVVDLNGDVGIGTDSPNNRFVVCHGGAASAGNADIVMEANVTGEHAFLALEARTATDDAGLMMITQGTDAAIWFDESADLLRISIGSAVATNDNRQDNTVMVIDASTGNVGIGTTNPSLAKLFVQGTGSSSAQSYGYLDSAGATDTASSSQVYSIACNGQSRASEFHATSDRRIKKNLEESNYQEDLNMLDSLKTYNYDYIDQKFTKKNTRKGVIAQELEEQYPSAVTKCSDFVPNIYKVGSISEDGKVISVEFEEHEDIKVGTTVKLMIYKVSDDEGEVVEIELENIGTNQLTLKNPIDLEKYYDELFVTGTRVEDFRNISNDDMLYISVGAIKQLKTENDQLKSQMADILARLNTLEQA